MANILDLYFGGDLEVAIPLTGQVMGRINEARSANDVVDSTMAGFYQCFSWLRASYG
jgi:enoyl-[acyl-carrier protein] reductase II